MLRRTGVFAVLLVIGFSIAFKAPSLVLEALVNRAMIKVVTIRPCDPQRNVCTQAARSSWYPPEDSGGEKSSMEQALGLLEKASSVSPTSGIVQLHLAEVLFALGRYSEAAELLKPHKWIENDSSLTDQLKSIAVGVLPERISPLLLPGRYEYHLLRAYRNTAEENWEAAVREFDLALALAREQESMQVRQDSYRASAQWHLQLSEQEPTEKCLAGKYFTLAGEPETAIETLAPLMSLNNEHRNTELGWCAFYLGQAYEAELELPLAIEAYRQGWQTAPQIRMNGMRLLSLLRQSGDHEAAQRIRAEVLNAGPEYRSGLYDVGDSYAPISLLPSGFGFVGYDVDAETVSHGGPLELWIWWQMPAAGSATIPTGDDWLDLGDYLVQHQWVKNLAFNNGFEFGEKPDGVPFGWAWRMYSESPQSLYVTPVARNGQTNHVVVASNVISPSSGLMGEEVPVETDGWYLMAGWMKQEGSTSSNIGRTCTGSRFQASGPYFATWLPISAIGSWVHIADVAPAFPNDYPEQCRIMLINVNNPRGTAMWDDLIFARILSP